MSSCKTVDLLPKPEKRGVSLTPIGPHHFVKADLWLNFDGATRMVQVKDIQKLCGFPEGERLSLDLSDAKNLDKVLGDFSNVIRAIKKGETSPFTRSKIALSPAWNLGL